MWGRETTIHGKTFLPPPLPPHPTAGFSFHAMREKATEGSEFMWGTCESIFQAEQSRNKAIQVNGVPATWNAFQLQRGPSTSGRSDSGFHLHTACLSFLSRETVFYSSSGISLIVLMVTLSVWCAPCSPRIHAAQTQSHLSGKLGQSAGRRKQANNASKLNTSNLFK